jgi:hypothetical protein
MTLSAPTMIDWQDSSIFFSPALDALNAKCHEALAGTMRAGSGRWVPPGHSSTALSRVMCIQPRHALEDGVAVERARSPGHDALGVWPGTFNSIVSQWSVYYMLFL